MTSSHTPDSPKKPPRGSRQSRKHTPKANTKGLYQRAFKEAFVKLNPRVMLKNPVMFVVWTGTIVTALLTIDPTLFGPAFGKNQVVFNGLVTLILFFTLVFANFAEAVAEGRQSPSRCAAIDKSRHNSPQTPTRRFNSRS
jgi:K+-transporting ATPase ATPase B chain